MPKDVSQVLFWLKYNVAKLAGTSAPKSFVLVDTYLVFPLIKSTVSEGPESGLGIETVRDKGIIFATPQSPIETLRDTTRFS